MKVIKCGTGRCDHCADQGLDCNHGSPKCSNCMVAGIECIKFKQRVLQACDRCRSKKIRCDGVRPSCTQCINVGFECKTSDKLSRRAFPRSYTESLEERVRSLEAETRELKDLLDEKDDEIGVLAGVASTAPIMQLAKPKARKRKEPSKLKPAQVSELATKHLHILTFEVERNEIDEEVLASKQSQKKAGIFEWVEEKIKMARRPRTAPAINLLVIETPEDLMEEEPRRTLYDEVLLLTKPALDSLGIPSNVLGTFGSAVFDKSSPDILHSRNLDTNSAQTFMYHIALGFFSLAFRYFPESKTCIGILLVQNYKDVAAELLRDLNTHQVLIGQPLLLPLLAQQAMTKLITSWLTQHKEVIIDAQSQTGIHHMLSLRKSSEFMDYARLSATISGTAVNIATNELCWHVLADHAEHMVEQLKGESNSALVPRSELDFAVASFMEHHASRVARNARVMLHEAESWQKKALILVQGIFNLIAQQDQNTSIGIARDSKTLAEESKRDSTSMEAIAIVTMTYLPGTFAAVCFLTRQSVI